ncbi:hypothetical protein [Acidipropionibacterium virtanenii]|nr:hypothetical protein [Acidipropionibacterium virtanenii]
MSQNPYGSANGAGPQDPYSQASAGQGPYSAQPYSAQPNGAQQPIVDPYAGDPSSTPGSYAQQPTVDPYAASQPYPQGPYGQDPYGQNPYGQVPVPVQQPYAQGYGPNMPADGGMSNVAPNLWLSAFFGWIPALIYFLSCKDNCAPTVRKAHADNLSFQLIRLIVLCVPYVGVLAALVLFIIAIIHATQVPGQVRSGQQARFTLTPDWIH